MQNVLDVLSKHVNYLWASFLSPFNSHRNNLLKTLYFFACVYLSVTLCTIKCCNNRVLLIKYFECKYN